MCLLSNLSDVLFIYTKHLFSSVRLFKSSSANTKRLAFFGEKQEQGLVGLETPAHVRNLTQYFFPFLPPRGTLWVQADFLSISGMGSQSLVTTPLTLLIQLLPFASKSAAVAAPTPQPPLRAHPGRGSLGFHFSVHLTPVGLSLSAWLPASRALSCHQAPDTWIFLLFPHAGLPFSAQREDAHPSTGRSLTPSGMAAVPWSSRSHTPRVPRVPRVCQPSPRHLRGQPRCRSPAGKAEGSSRRRRPRRAWPPRLWNLPWRLGMSCGGNGRARASRPRAARRGNPAVRFPPRQGSGKAPAPSLSPSLPPSLRRPSGRPGSRCPGGKGAAGPPGGGISPGRGRRRSLPPGAVPAPLPLPAGPRGGTRGRWMPPGDVQGARWQHLPARRLKRRRKEGAKHESPGEPQPPPAAAAAAASPGPAAAAVPPRGHPSYGTTSEGLLPPPAARPAPSLGASARQRQLLKPVPLAQLRRLRASSRRGSGARSPRSCLFAFAFLEEAGVAEVLFLRRLFNRYCYYSPPDFPLLGEGGGFLI